MEKNLKDNDYVLVEGAGWFRVENLAVRIHKTDEGVVVDIYSNGLEMGGPVASTYAFFAEATEYQEEAKEAREELAEWNNA